jgi:mannose-6-phosphate isomerase-like protein (cupin superfamily)
MSDPQRGEPFEIQRFPVHLGLGARVTRLPQFDGTLAWYERYGQSTSDDGIEGRLVSMHTFREPWSSWEVHPHGEELVLCLSGRLTLHQEIADGVKTVVLEPGQAVVNPPGIWHTADVSGETSALFVTAGLGTENRDR